MDARLALAESIVALPTVPLVEDLPRARCEAFAAELRDSVRRVTIIGEIAGEPVQVVPPPVPQPQSSKQESP